MSKRLQVLIADDEMQDIQSIATQEQLVVGEWVRQTLRAALASRSAMNPKVKLAAVRHGAGYSFPTADIEQMLSEIDKGYGS